MNGNINELIEKATKKVNAVIISKFSDYPLFALMIKKFPLYVYYVPKENEKRLPFIAFTNQRYIAVSVNNVLELNESELFALLVHEVLHDIFLHPSRAVALAKKYNFDSFVLNVYSEACDVVVDHYIESSGMKVPYAYKVSDFCRKYNLDEKDVDINKMSAEDLTLLVLKKLPKSPKTTLDPKALGEFALALQLLSFILNTANQLSQQINNPDKQEITQILENIKNSPLPDNVRNLASNILNGLDQKSQSQLVKELKDLLNQINSIKEIKYNNITIRFIEAVRTGDKFADDIINHLQTFGIDAKDIKVKQVYKGDERFYEDENFKDYNAVEGFVKELVRELVTVKQIWGIGREPLGLLRKLEELAKPKIDWRTIIRSVLVPHVYGRIKRSWARPSRKHNDLPSTMHLGLNTVHCLVDTSGSIGTEELRQFVSEIYGIAKAVKTKVIVYPWDATAYVPIVMKSHKDINKVKANMRGGGGTVIKPTLEKVLKQLKRNDIVIIFSDWLIDDINSPKTQEMLKKIADLSSLAFAVSTKAEPRVPNRWIKKVIEI